MVVLARETDNGYIIDHDGDKVTVTLPIQFPNSYLIRVNDETVGYIEITNNTIVQIDVCEEREGYGTAALNNLMELFEQSQYSAVTTTTVTSSAFEAILLEYGFEQSSTETDNAYRYIF